MPVINSDYKPPFLLKNRHVQTLLPHLRKIKISYQREKFNTPDDDFIDLDWSKIGSHKLAIFIPGLEGNSEKTNMTSLLQKINRTGWDVVIFNYRGSFGPNNLLKSYNGGDIEDLTLVIEHVQKNYEQIVLVGCSIGGNVAIKYAGIKGKNINKKITHVATFSSPLTDLKEVTLKVSSNWIYNNYFLSTYKEKIKEKHQKMPDYPVKKIKNLMDYDKYYIVPYFKEFKDLDDYYEKSSSLKYIGNITIPVYTIISQDDPFLTKNTINLTYEAAIISKSFVMEKTNYGGHCGFLTGLSDNYYEDRIVNFINDKIKS